MGRTIRTCSVLAALLAVCAGSAPALASTDITAMRAYVRGREAINSDALGEAARQFQMALRSAPGNELLQKRTFGLALLAGDERLAQDLARQLTAGDAIGFDTRTMLLAAAIEKRRWDEAQSIRKAMSDDNQLGFALPIIDAWLRMGRDKGDPLQPLATKGQDALANSYADEHRAFLLGATGHIDAALTAYAPLVTGTSGRSIRMRLAAAAMLQHDGRKEQARQMLAGSDPALVRARNIMERGRRLHTGVFTPADGIAELFARLAADLGRDHYSDTGILLARVATFLAPDNAETWLVAASMLTDDNKPAAALGAVEKIGSDDPFIGQATSLRIGLLMQLGRKAEALGIAQAMAARSDAGTAEWAQLADVLASNDQTSDAINAYGKAISLTKAPAVLWQLYMLRGGLYEQSGDWSKAEPDLRKAVELGPDQAVALNYLGYSLLDRRIKLDEAQRLIEQAHALRPTDGAITDSLAWVYYRRGDYARAVPLLEEAARLAPAEPTINEHLGDAYWQVGRKLEARFSWRAALVGADDQAEKDRLAGKINYGLDVAGSLAAQ